MSAGEMMAALYREYGQLRDIDLADDRDVWERAALVIVQDGLFALYDLADDILVREHRGTLCDPRWLKLCRRRVAEVTRDLLPDGNSARTGVLKAAGGSTNVRSDR